MFRPTLLLRIACLGAWTSWAPLFAAPSPAGPDGPGKGPAAGGSHWAFRPVRRPEPPAVRDRAWVRNPVDAFILTGLERAGIAPAPEVDRATLIRRVTLDLLGLLPSPEEVEEFVEDRRPGAYETLVDRLLASPHHAELWARHWLDLARYADSNGYTIDGSRSIWKYRDWVIEALARDLPFDRFTIAQIAGDMIPGATIHDRVATGFHRNTLRNEEGGTDAEQFRVEAVADRVSTTALVFLGLTAGCARCHDHKYDPISQREYFQLFALFNNADEPALPVPTSQEARELPALETEIASVRKLLAENEVAVNYRQEVWERGLEGRLQVDWTPLESAAWRVESGERGEVHRAEAPAPFAGISAVRLEAPPEGSLRLSEFRVLVEAPEARAEASAAGLRGDRAVDHAVLVLNEGTSIGKDVRLAFTVALARPAAPGSRLRLSATSAPAGVAALPPQAAAVLAKPRAERTAEEKERLAAYYRSIDKDFVPLAAREADLRKRQADLKKSITTTLVIAERKVPRETRVHLRGDFLRPGDQVEGGVPAVLPPLGAAGRRADRLDLARWLVDRRNPLTSRVTVNRLWQAYFGRGIVATENDFGTQGEPPEHPELLDWLASEFMEQGWSLKSMHRLLVTSSTYRQSSLARPEIGEIDPHHKLLGRQVRLRLEAEVIRDAALAASGLLNSEVGGPGVYPPQPQSIFRFTQTAKYWKESRGPDRFRRGMYTYFWRSSPYPFLMTFDGPDATVSCTRRVRSNTPLQALTLANDPAFFEMAEALAARTLREAGAADEERILRLFRISLARSPGERELARLRAFLCRERERSAADPDRGGAERRAFTALARVVLNLDEFITRE